MRKLLGAFLVLTIAGAIAVYTGFADPVFKSGVQSSLMDGGMGEKRAACMADRMVERLSLWQLYKLRQGMAPLEGETEQPEGLGETIKRLRRGTDTETVAVVTTSAGLCAIGIG